MVKWDANSKFLYNCASTVKLAYDFHDDELVIQEVKKRLSSEAVAAANQNGRWKNQMRRVAHNGCCRRVAQTRALCSVLWKLLISEGLIEALKNIEIPLVNILLISVILP